MKRTALFIQMTGQKCSPEGGKVLFNEVLYADGPVCLNPKNGSILLNACGRYRVNWWTALSNETAECAVYGLEVSGLGHLLGNAPASGQVCGFALFAAQGPTELSLVNLSGFEVLYNGCAPVQAALMLEEEL